MEHLYNRNGLVFWTEDEILAREEIASRLVRSVCSNLKEQNRGFWSSRVEAPQLTPIEMINPNYSEDDYFRIDDLALRPETTMGSYAYAQHLLTSHKRLKLPCIIWQHGKSFRREQDQVVKNMRLKEFYQLEFQIIFDPSTMNDYSVKLIPAIQKTIQFYVGPCKIEPSDRIPDYAEWTQDIVREENDMEVCSVSLRKDCDFAKDIEVAIGTDRLVYNHFLHIDE